MTVVGAIRSILLKQYYVFFYKTCNYILIGKFSNITFHRRHYINTNGSGGHWGKIEINEKKQKNGCNRGQVMNSPLNRPKHAGKKPNESAINRPGNLSSEMTNQEINLHVNYRMQRLHDVHNAEVATFTISHFKNSKYKSTKTLGKKCQHKLSDKIVRAASCLIKQLNGRPSPLPNIQKFMENRSVRACGVGGGVGCCSGGGFRMTQRRLRMVGLKKIKEKETHFQMAQPLYFVAAGRTKYSGKLQPTFNSPLF